MKMTCILCDTADPDCLLALAPGRLRLFLSFLYLISCTLVYMRVIEKIGIRTSIEICKGSGKNRQETTPKMQVRHTIFDAISE